jgi:twinkle protein
MGLLEEVVSIDQELTGSGRWLKGSTNDSLVVDKDRQLFFWNSKGISGDVYIWLTKIKGMSHESAKTFLKQFSGYSTTFIHEINNKEESIVYPKLVDSFYENGTSHRDYWTRRGINESTISRFKLGWNNDWYTVPIYMDGIFKNFQLRRDIPSREVYFYYKHKGPLLFNSDIMKITDTIIINEGLTDCLRLSQEGIACVSGTTGSGNWLNEWYPYFLHQKKIFIVYDNDKAGRDGAKMVADKLGIYRCYIYTFWDYDKSGYDIVTFFNQGNTKDDLMRILNTSAKRSFEL